MILIKTNLIQKFSDFPAPIGSVGIYSVYDNDIKDLVIDIDHRIVNDDIKFPIAAKTPKDKLQEINFSGVKLPDNFAVIAGPCSAESEKQVFDTVKFLKSIGIQFFRAGCFKPRTNAYSFQGLGKSGLKLCRDACDEFNLTFVSEVKDLSNLDVVQEFADIIQVGSKCMYDVGVLRNLGQQRKPILLKRHFGATLKEFAQAADFIMCEGNESVVFCERGIRSFESNTRFSLDSCGIEWLKKNTRLNIIGDPSHAMGYSYGVPGLSLSLIAQQVSGLIIEVHPSPKLAKSDASQQLDFNEFEKLYKKITSLHNFIKNIRDE